MINLGSIFNTAIVGQANYQSANNVSLFSLGTTQATVQSAGNGAQIVQGR